MEHRRIGSLEVSVVGIGCNNFGVRLDQAGTDAVVAAALDEGITLFDTADIYGASRSESFLASALGARRSDVVIATKFGLPSAELPGGGSAAYVRSACERSLRELRTDVIDLYQYHVRDSTVPLEETMEAMAELVAEGKVREIGCSNFSGDDLRTARAIDGVPDFASVQNQYSLLWREPERDVLAALDELDMGLLPFYPLGNGLLTGKYHRGEAIDEGTRLGMMPDDRRTHWLSDAMLDIVESIRAISDDVGIPMATLAFSWLAHHPRVSSVIAGASKAEQVRQNAAAVVSLDPSVIERLDEATASMVSPA
jgi:aryl-alcohol dehydrogenase-like predicted oxidoreductase